MREGTALGARDRSRDASAPDHGRGQDRLRRATWVAGFAVARAQAGEVTADDIDDVVVLADRSIDVVEVARIRVTADPEIDAATRRRVVGLLAAASTRLEGPTPRATPAG